MIWGKWRHLTVLLFFIKDNLCHIFELCQRYFMLIQILERRNDLGRANCALSSRLLNFELEDKLLVKLVFALLMASWDKFS